MLLLSERVAAALHPPLQQQLASLCRPSQPLHLAEQPLLLRLLPLLATPADTALATSAVARHFADALLLQQHTLLFSCCCLSRSFAAVVPSVGSATAAARSSLESKLLLQRGRCALHVGTLYLLLHHCCTTFPSFSIDALSSRPVPPAAAAAARDVDRVCCSCCRSVG